MESDWAQGPQFSFPNFIVEDVVLPLKSSKVSWERETKAQGTVRGNVLLSPAALTLDIMKSRKHSVGRGGGLSLRRWHFERGNVVLSGQGMCIWCEERVTGGHSWTPGTRCGALRAQLSQAEGRKRPKTAPPAPELLIPGGQCEIAQQGEGMNSGVCWGRPCFRWKNRSCGIETMWCQIPSSLLTVLWPHLLEEFYFPCV